jgi:hypothetical protein
MKLFVALLALAMTAPSLVEVRAIPDPLRRFNAAIACAEHQYAQARELVREFGSRQELESHLNDLADAYQLALDALKETGRKPSRLGRQYKKGEVSTREVERMLHEVALAVTLDDRPLVQRAHARVTAVHDEFLQGVMSK